MYGGYSLLPLINRGEALTPFQVSWFRAGHAHAGVPAAVLGSPRQHISQPRMIFRAHDCRAAESGLGRITIAGAALLVCAIAVLVDGFVERLPGGTPAEVPLVL